MLIKKYYWEVIMRLCYILYGGFSCACVGFYFRKEVYILISKPFLRYINDGDFIYTNVLEIMYSYIGISLIIGLFVTLGLTLYNAYDFMRISSYRYNIKKLRIILFSWFFVTCLYSMTVKYLLLLVFMYLDYMSKGALGSDVYFSFEPKVSEYTYIVISGGVLCYILYMIPLFISWLLYYQVISWESLLKWRVIIYSILLIIILLVFPPDMFIHIGVFIVIYMIYELMLLMSSIFMTYKELG